MVQFPTNNDCLSKADQRIADRCERSGLVGHWSVGIANTSFSESESASQILFWFPLGLPDGSSVSVSSSRMSRKLDEHPEWFDALRTLAVHISQTSDFLITASGTTAHVFVDRLAKLFQIPVLQFEPFPEHPSLAWFNHQVEPENVSGQGSLKFKAFFNPLEGGPAKQPKFNVDDLLIGLARTAVLLSVRRNGNIHKSARRRIAGKPDPGTRLLINRKLTPESVQSDLLGLGATAWWLYDVDSPDLQVASENQLMSPEQGMPNAPILRLNEIESENYVAHWTRRRVGPWPDQSQPEYLDDLIFQTSRRLHGKLSTLCRILAIGRILGSHGLTRDARDVVCFSELPLDEILNQRVFRPHLGRWDFEPYGIAIDKQCLKRLGARPVFYGDDGQWEQLSEFDQAFFQLKTSQSSNIDWTKEQEWRLIGDLILDNIPVDQAVVFVKSKSDAHTVSGLSRWPIVILSEYPEN